MDAEPAAVFVKCEPGPATPPAAGGVGRLVDSSQADDRRVIALVRARPLLYARSNLPVASYHSQVKRLWREVADIMGWTVADVRRKWSHIRNSYSRHLRNEMHGVRTGRGRAVSRWYLADELAFLREHMATDTRPCPISLVAAVSPYAALAGPPRAEAEGPSDAAGGVWGAPPAEDGAEPDEAGAYFQFFRGIYTDYRELSPRRRRRFRRECLALLHRLLDAEGPPGGHAGDGGGGAPRSPAA